MSPFWGSESRTQPAPPPDPAPPPAPALEQVPEPVSQPVSEPVSEPVSAATVQGVGDLDEMSSEVASRWDEVSDRIGRAIYPAVQELHTSLPDATAIMVCTQDGLNVVALGLDDSQVARLSALATSMFSVGRAAAQVTRKEWANASPQTLVMHDDDDHHTVLMALGGSVAGGLLLWVTARSTSLGPLLVRGRRTSEEVAQLLAAEGLGAPVS